jgi:hypothetical protein
VGQPDFEENTQPGAGAAACQRHSAPSCKTHPPLRQELAHADAAPLSFPRRASGILSGDVHSFKGVRCNR